MTQGRISRWTRAGAAAVALALACAAHAERVQTLVPKTPAPGGERRVALVMGNSAYKSSPLRNPVNDARAIARELVATGFTVVLVEDATLSGMRRTVRAFGDELARGGAGLFYYAGHGMQVRGKNFLIPVNADIDREDEVEDQAIDANLVLSKMDSARNALNIMILDACRNNPFARSFRSAAQGLAQMDAPSGTLIAFATAPGSVAADGDGENGIYTKHLLSAIRQPGVAIEQLFKNVRVAVTRETGDRQVPWESSSLKGDFFFRPADPLALSADQAKAQQAVIERAVAESARQQQEASARDRADLQKQMEQMLNAALERQRQQFEAERAARGETKAAPPAPPAALAAAAPPMAVRSTAPDSTQIEIAFWDSIKTSANPEDFRAYLDRYPQGNFAPIARNRLAAVSPRPPAPAAASAQTAAAAPTAPTPAQVASIAPATPVTAPAPPKSRALSVGDWWRYSYVTQVSGVAFANPNKQELYYEVKAVTPEGVLERAVLPNGAETSWAHSSGATMVDFGALIFSPHYLAFKEPSSGESLGEIRFQNYALCRDLGSNCKFQGRVAGRERVTTAAGSFDAYKIVVEMTTYQMAQVSSNYYKPHPNTIELTFWLSAAAKRIVKASQRWKQGNYAGGFDYNMELVAYGLQDGGGVGAK